MSPWNKYKLAAVLNGQDFLHSLVNKGGGAAERSFISKPTAITRSKNLSKNFKVKNVAGLVRRGFELGILKTGISPSVATFMSATHYVYRPWQRIVMATVLLMLNIFCLYTSTFSQVTNGEINWEVKVLDYNYTGQTDGSSPFPTSDQNQDEPTFLLQARDKDQPIQTDRLGKNFYNRPCMSTGIPGAPDPHPGVDTFIAFNNCYPFDNIFCYDDPNNPFNPAAGMTIDRAICRTADSLIMGIYAFEDDSYDYTTGQPNYFGPERYVCSENTGLTGRPDTELIKQRWAQVLDGHNVNKFVKYSASGPNTEISLLSVYTFINGNTRNQPLDFGQIPYGATRTHRNSGYDDGLCTPFIIEGEGGCNLGGDAAGYDFNWNIGEKVISDGDGSRYYTFTVSADGALIDIDIVEEDGAGAYVALYRSGPSSGSLLAATTFGVNGIDPLSICKKHPDDTDNTEFTTYTVEVQYHGEFEIQISASPTSGCLDNVENSFSNTDYNVDFGLPDRTACATGNSPFQTFENMTLANLKDDIDAMIANTVISQFHVLHKDEASLNGLFVQSKGAAIALSKTVKVYHYRQQLGAGVASDNKDFFLLEDSTITAGTEFLAKNYIITPPSGSKGDAIVFEIYTGTGSNRLTIAAPLLVTGIDLVANSIGQTVVPSQVDMILYDPPGGGSYAGFEKEFTVCREVSNTISKTDGSGGNVQLKLGIKGQVGFLFAQDFELSTSYNNEFSVAIDTAITNTFTKCTSIKATYKTSTSPTRVGANGDLFIGTGEEWVWGYVDSIGLDMNCTLTSDTSFVAALDGPGTQFAWDLVKVEKEMQDLQNEITALSAAIMANPNIDPAIKLDKSRKEEQLRVWNEVMSEYQAKRNDRNSNQIKSFAWSGGVGGESFETSVTNSKTIEAGLLFDQSVGQDFVATFGASGVEGGYRLNLTRKLGATITTNQTTTKEISYEYVDGAGDSHDGVITRDPDYGTHIFHLDNTSETSCPYEAGTPRDMLSIGVSCSPQGPFAEQIYLENLDPNNDVTLYVQICNNNPNESRNTSWRLDGNMGINGSIAFQFNGQAGQQIMNFGFISSGCFTLPLEFPADNNLGNYDDLVLRVYPACFDDFDADPGETLILEQSDFITVNLTFGGPGGYPNGSLAACSGNPCIDIMDLNVAFGALDGTYSAGSKIRLLPGVQINPGSNITLDAPEVEMQEADVPGTAVLTVLQNGCN